MSCAEFVGRWCCLVLIALRRSPVIQRGLEDSIASLKSATGRTRCGEPGAHLSNLRRLFLYSGRESLNLLLLLRYCRSQLCNCRFLVIDFVTLGFEFSVFFQEFV